MNIIALGDTHIGCWPKNVPQTFAYWSMIFNQVTQYAEEHNVKTIVQLGDLFDNSAPSREAEFFFLKLMRKNSRFRFKFYNGNHDYTDIDNNSFNYFLKLQKFGLLKNAKFITQPTLESGKDSILYLPWPHIDTSLCSKPSLVFAHVSVPGAQTDNGYVIKESSTVPKFGKHKWVIGDLHTFQKHQHYIYPGAPLQFRYNDTPDRYFLHITGSYPFKINRVPIKLPYVLEQYDKIGKVSVQGKKLLRKLEQRSEITFTKVKLDTDAYSTDFPHQLEQFPRITVEPVKRIDSTISNNDEVVIHDEDSNALRLSLTVEHLRKKAYDEINIKRALSLIKELEANND